jgi:hypothetical protein
VTYQPAFVRSGIELAPLTMPLGAAREPFAFANLPELTCRRLPGLLADALPDEFGNALIDAWMAQHGVRKSDVTSLDRLAYMGSRGRAVRGKIDTDVRAEAALAQIIQWGPPPAARAPRPLSPGMPRRRRSGPGSLMCHRGSSTG